MMPLVHDSSPPTSTRLRPRTSSGPLAGLLLGLLALGAGPAVQAQIGLPFGDSRKPATPPSANDLVQVRVLADTDRVTAGATFEIAVVFEIAPHWHVYWENAGDSGAPTEITIDAPDGFRIGPTRFPRPRAFAEVDGRSFGYEKETVLFVPITAPEGIAPGTEIALNVDVFFLACRERCLIGRATRSLRLPVIGAGGAGAGSSANEASLPEIVRRHRARLPRPLAQTPGAEARIEGSGARRRLVVSGPAAGAGTLELFPIDSPGVVLETPRIEIAGDRFRIEVPLELKPQNALGRRLRARGVIGLGSRVDEPSYHFDVPIAEP